MGDGDLLRRLADDVDGGFAAVVRRYQDEVFTVALRCTGHRQSAEDLTQDTFVAAYRALQRYPAEQVLGLRLRPFLVTIALNGARNGARRAGRRPAEVPLDGRCIPAAPAGERPEAAADRRSGDEALAARLARLPERYRQPVVLRCILGFSYAEMADTLGEPVGTLKARVSRGLARLREEEGA